MVGLLLDADVNSLNLPEQQTREGEKKVIFCLGTDDFSESTA